MFHIVKPNSHRALLTWIYLKNVSNLNVLPPEIMVHILSFVKYNHNEVSINKYKSSAKELTQFVSILFIFNNLELDWNWKWIFANYEITTDCINFLKKYMPKRKLDKLVARFCDCKYIEENDCVFQLAENDTLSNNFVLKHRNLNWKKTNLVYNNNISTKIVEKVSDPSTLDLLFTGRLPFYKTIDYISANIDDSDAKELALLFLNFDEIAKLYLDIDCNLLIRHEEFMINVVENNLDMEWDWFLLSRKCHNINFIKKYKEKNWNWFELSEKIHINDILQNLDLDWQWTKMYKNNSITIKHIRANPKLPWIRNLHAIQLKCSTKLLQ